ncbi:MAG: peptide MFS transporter [Candidatus Melainabacteria bacterium]|nr:peptide MFS transporter [Candidatus Melainabacteria bacterium]
MDVTANETAPAEGTFAGHPKGLFNLFFTEMWERFSYYGMRAILVLYMVAAVSDGGLALTNKEAGQIYGLYTMAVYLSALAGGFVGDKIFGARRAVLIGGIIIACGHFTIAFASTTTLFIGMFLIVLGTGLLKPNMATIVGALYKPGDMRRDAGFSIFYMGVNVGAMLAPIVCGYLAQGNEFKAWLSSVGISPLVSWHFGFAAAGIGMVVGLIVYVSQAKLLGTAGLKSVAEPAPLIENSPKADFLSRDEWRRLGAIGVLFVFNILFWAIYEQGGSSLNIFANKCVDNTIFGWSFPSSWLQTFQAGFIVLFAPIISMIWLKLGDKQPTAPTKFAIGIVLLGLGISLMVPASMLAAQGKVSPLWLIGVFLFECLGELCLSPVGLSTVTKLAPARFAALTMGAWYLSISIGNYTAGSLSGLFDEKNTSGMTTLFGSMALAALVAAVLMALLVPTVKKLMGNIK